MTTSTTIEQAKAQKEKLRERINAAIQDFTYGTGLTVTSIDLKRISHEKVGGRIFYIHTDIDVKVELP